MKRSGSFSSATGTSIANPSTAFNRPSSCRRTALFHMRYTYDNSKANIRNPNSPPIRVKAGNRSVDEMGHLWLQVLPRALPNSNQDPRLLLEQAWMQNMSAKEPRRPHRALQPRLGRHDRQRLHLCRNSLSPRTDAARQMMSEPSPHSAPRSTGQGTGSRPRPNTRKLSQSIPEYADARFDLAHLEFKHGSYAEAEQEYRRLLVEDPKDAAAHNELGGVLAATNRPTDAQHEFETAIALDPGNFDALYNLAGIEADNNNLPRASELLEQALKQKDDADAHQLLGNIYAQSGRLADALRTVQGRSTPAATRHRPASSACSALRANGPVARRHQRAERGARVRSEECRRLE